MPKSGFWRGFNPFAAAWLYVDKSGLYVDYYCIFADKFVTLLVISRGYLGPIVLNHQLR